MVAHFQKVWCPQNGLVKRLSEKVAILLKGSVPRLAYVPGKMPSLRGLGFYLWLPNGWGRGLPEDVCGTLWLHMESWGKW